jgi:uncharacterized protein
MSETGRFEIAGKELHCSHCGGENFRREQARIFKRRFLDKSGWASPKAVVLICTVCGFVHWFSETYGAPLPGGDWPEDVIAPDSSEGDDRSEPTQCLACCAAIPPGQVKCPECGWTYTPS